MFKFSFIRVLDAVASVPPLRLNTVVPIAALLLVWTALLQSGVEADCSFVCVVVIGQAFVVWLNLPRAARALCLAGRDRRDLLVWPVAATLALAALQITVCEPVFTQRLLSVGCVFVLIIMALGMRHQNEVLARVGGGIETKPVSLMPINALMAALTLTVNELLISVDKAEVWVMGMALYALALHTVYWFMVLLVLPADDIQA